MLWLMCFSIFALSSGCPFQSIQGRNELKKYRVQMVEFDGSPFQRHSVCLPSPLLSQIRLPSALQFFIPLQILETGQLRCLTIPITRTYVIKVCPPTKENSNESFHETTKEVVTEEEKERPPDNASIEVNEEEVKSGDFVKGGSGVEAKESQAEDKNTKNNPIRDSEETDFGKNDFLERLPNDKNLDDEDISIKSNLV